MRCPSGNCHLGNCPSEKCPSRNCSFGGLPALRELSILKCLWGTVRQGKIRRGTVLEPLRLPKTNASRYVTQAVSFKGSILWNTVPNRYKNVECLDKFILQIKMWKPTTCTWELCKAC